MILFSLVLATLLGLQVNWSAQPVPDTECGALTVRVRFTEGDLLFVTDGAEDTAFWEVSAAAGGRLARMSGSLRREDLPATEELILEGLSTGTHLLTVTVTDLETGNSRTWEESAEIMSLDAASWSSAGLQVAGGMRHRAAGTAEVAWDVYPPAALHSREDTLKGAFMVRDAAGGTVREGWMDMTSSGGSLRAAASVELDGLDAGEYELRTALVSAGEVLTAAGANFEVLQAWDVWGEDPDRTKTLVRPIARSSELSDLDAAGGPSGRRAVMAEFWQRRDPTPGTPRNEYLEMYLARLDQIEKRFSFLNVNGVKTDQGRVYALLGEPDIIDSRPMESSMRATQVWTYFSPPLELLFIDYNDCGNYELAGDWGEVQALYERRR